MKSAIFLALAATVAQGKLMHTREKYESAFGEFIIVSQRPARPQQVSTFPYLEGHLPAAVRASRTPSFLIYGVFHRSRGGRARAPSRVGPKLSPILAERCKDIRNIYMP